MINSIIIAFGETEHCLIVDNNTKPRGNKSIEMCKKCSLKSKCYDGDTCRNLCVILGGNEHTRFNQSYTVHVSRIP